MTRQSLQDVLGGLRQAGLAEVAERADTGRARPITLTPEGRARLRAAEEVVTAVERQMLGGLGAASGRTLSTLLATCAENLSAEF
ncbi:hypothetical protein [Nocardia araoensis]|uniref:hypothetical protein n=1 Tax=Nocardia araoensis TaxID=228600 RepID=UPI00030F9248|nr:hypothetical protein [Nocardia araoensis]